MAFNRVQQIKFKWFDANNNPASGWLVNTFEAGLAGDLVDTYSDNTGTLNDNPIVLDDRGEANIYLDSELAYKFIITNSTGGESQTQDNITGSGGVVSGGGGPEGAVGSIQYNFDGTNQKGFGSVASGVVKLNDDVGDVIADFSTPTEAKLSVKFDSGLVEIGAISGSSYIELGNVRLDSNGDVIASSFIGDGSQLTGLPEPDLSGLVPYTGATGDVNLGSNNLIVTGDIGSSSYADYVKNIFTKTLRIQNASVLPTEPLLNIRQNDSSYAGNMVEFANRGLGTALAVSIDDSNNTSDVIFASGTKGIGVYGRSDFDYGVQALTVNGDYALSARGGTDASILAENGIISTGPVTTNGVTNFGRLASAPTPLLSGDQYYDQLSPSALRSVASTIPSKFASPLR